MVHTLRPAFAALALGLALFAAGAAGGDEPPAKAARPARVEAELNRLRALEPAERLKLVAKLAGAAEPFTAVRRGDLAAAVVERGTVEPVDFADLACRLKARGQEGAAAATVRWVVADGTMVKKGERVLVLDDTAAHDRHRAAAARVTEAEEALARAVEAVRVAQKEAAVAVRLAEIEVKLAEIELRALPAGPAREAAELKVERAKLRRDRAGLRGKTRLAQAEAEQRARAAARETELGRRAEAEDELKLCTLVAPLDGMAVYHAPRAGRFGGAPPLGVGEGVREGQKLVRVVGLKQFAVATRVHESVVAAVRVGQAVRVRVDAFPDRVLRGTVAQVAAVAAAPEWAAGDVKVYPVTVAIEDAPPGLKPDMTCEVRVATGELKGVLVVPRTAVVRAGRDRVCYVKSGQELQERRVVTGAAGETAVEIRDGLREGDLVAADLPALLVRP